MKDGNFSHQGAHHLGLFSEKEISYLLGDANNFSDVNMLQFENLLRVPKDRDLISSKFNLLSNIPLSNNKFLYLDNSGMGIGIHFPEKDYFIKAHYVDAKKILNRIIGGYSRMMSEQYIYNADVIDSLLQTSDDDFQKKY